MNNLNRVEGWIEAGKQVGKSALLGEGNEAYWIWVGVQKWEGEYKLYLRKAKESRMGDLDYYDFEGTIKVTYFEALAELISAFTTLNLDELTPQKGSKIFNPEFD